MLSLLQYVLVLGDLLIWLVVVQMDDTSYLLFTAYCSQRVVRFSPTAFPVIGTRVQTIVAADLLFVIVLFPIAAVMTKGWNDEMQQRRNIIT